MHDFYNTIQSSGEELWQYKQDARTQQDEILMFFERNHHRSFSPSEVHQHLYAYDNTPLTSVRRAITNLTNAGLLIKLPKYKTGIYGKREHLWIYYQKEYQMELF